MGLWGRLAGISVSEFSEKMMWGFLGVVPVDGEV